MPTQRAHKHPRDCGALAARCGEALRRRSIEQERRGESAAERAAEADETLTGLRELLRRCGKALGLTPEDEAFWVAAEALRIEDGIPAVDGATHAERVAQLASALDLDGEARDAWVARVEAGESPVAALKG